MTPLRIQRQRTKGWRMPEGAVYVGRPSPWGNPFEIASSFVDRAANVLGLGADTREAAIRLYRAWVTGQRLLVPADRWRPTIQITEGTAGGSAWIEGFTVVDLPTRPDLAPLRGRDLVCWCPLDKPCHADVLLEFANRPESALP